MTRRWSLASSGSPSFVGTDQALELARTASHWSTRPSLLLGITDDRIAFALDEALAMREMIADRWAREGRRSAVGWDPSKERDALADDLRGWTPPPPPDWLVN